MPEALFDAWTRRRFGLATGGGVAALLMAFSPSVSRAKKHKKKHKKRCRKLGDFCRSGSKRRCCGTLKCNQKSAVNPARDICCKPEGKPCSPLSMEPECCGSLSCCGALGSEVCSTICFSDRNLKANFGSVDPADMLARVRELPIATWNYTSDDLAVRHIGPMAQDFAALFGVGADDRHIHPLDGQGVALAAIQGLHAEIQTMQADNAHLTERVAALEGRPPETR